MKKIILSFLAIGIFSIAELRAQTVWRYDFGTAAPTSITGASTPPTIPATQTNGGSPTLRVGSQGGAISLSNPNFGTAQSNASVVMTAPTGASLTKFIIASYGNATPGSTVATTKFKVNFGTATTGYFNFIQGQYRSTGAFTIGSEVTSATDDVFVGLRFGIAAGGVINLGYRLADAWTLVREDDGVTAKTLVQGTTYEIEMYMNNSASSASYTRGGAQTIAPKKFDLWINGVLFGNELGTGDFTLGKIDAFAFYGERSTSNAAVANFDDFVYSDGIAETGLPVSFTSFTGKANGPNIDLNWSTASEKDNKLFEIFRSADGKSFTKITSVNGGGTTTSAKSYSYTDSQPLPGLNYYQLKQVDQDGTTVAFPELVAIKSNVTASNFKIIANRGTSAVDVTVYAATAGNSTFKVYDLSGRKIIDKSLVLNKGFNSFSLPVQTSAQGMHVATLITATETITNKFIQ